MSVISDGVDLETVLLCRIKKFRINFNVESDVCENCFKVFVMRLNPMMRDIDAIYSKNKI